MKRRIPYYLFIVFLLGFVILVRSEIVPDRTFMPRLISLNLLLIVTFIIRFISGKKTAVSWYDILFFLFYLWSITSALWSIVPSEALAGSGLLFAAFALYIVIREMFISEEMKRFFIKVLNAIVLFSFIPAFVTMYGLEFFDPYRITSVSANNNLYSAFLLICFPFLLSGYSIFKGYWKIIPVVTGIISVFFMIIVQSRAGYLALFTSFIILFFFLFFRFRILFSVRNIRNGLAALMILIAAVSVFYFSLDDIRRNYFQSKIPVWNYFGSYESIEREKAERKLRAFSDLEHMAQFDYASDYYENASLRLIFWGKSVKLIKDHPFTGVGAANWRIVIPSSPKPPNPDHTFKNFTYSQPHNEWIGFVSELGIPGLILSLFIFLFPVMNIFIRTIKRKEISPEKLIFASFITGFCIFASFDFPFHRIEHLAVFIPALALINTGTGNDILSRPAINGGRVLSFLFMILIGFSLLINFYRFRGEYYTLKMFGEERKNDRSVIVLAEKAENWFYRITPNGLPVVWFRGVAEYRLDLKSQALISFEKAEKITPWEVRVLNDYGITLYDLDRKDQAVNMLRRTYETDSYFDDSKLNLAVIYIVSGRPDSARYFLKTCRDSEKKRSLEGIIE